MLVLEATVMWPHAVRVNDIHTTSLGKRYLGRQRVQLGGKHTPPVGGCILFRVDRNLFARL